MALEATEKLKDLLANAKNPLILIPADPGGDALGAATALSLSFQKSNREAPVALVNANVIDQRFSFLPKPTKIISGLNGARDFVIIFNTENNAISNVRSEKTDKEVRIYITPERALIEPRDFSFLPANCKYDLAIALGCRDKESIGKIYEDNADLFYEIPIVNIDYHADNEEFGQVNIVDLNSSSVSEILAKILIVTNEKDLDDSMAQCLLAGIISETDSFRKQNTTPQSLHMAAKLIEYGADQQEIIQHLYKTQPFPLLKLLGRAMSKLSWNEHAGLVWTNLTLEDFVQTRTKPADLLYVLDTIRTNYSSGRYFAALHADENGISGYVKTSRDSDLKNMEQVLGGKKMRDAVRFSLPSKQFAEAEKTLLQKITSPHTSR